MNFLQCFPSVFVVGQEYEIILSAKVKGLACVEIAGEKYYEDFAGILPTERIAHKIRVPQSALDNAERYTLLFKAVPNRQAYFTVTMPEESEEFSFLPLKKEQDIRALHIADVHYDFASAKDMARNIQGVDLFIVNGDIGEVETEENYLEVLEMIGDISQGKKPVLCARGNHDCRGKLAERYMDFLPSENGNTYFSFELGCLQGVVLDCGEDKADDYVIPNAETIETSKPYNGVNRFTPFRKRELAYLQSLNNRKPDKIFFAVSHICPVQTTNNKGDRFDIDREIYTQWNNELERLHTQFMICGHWHKTYILLPDDERNTVSHSYPVIIGAENKADDMTAVFSIGCLLIINKHTLNVQFVNKKGLILQEHQLLT